MSFEASFFIGNRQKLKQSLPEPEIIVIASNGTMQRSADTAYPFRQESNFWYLTGVNEPDIWLFMDKSGDYLVIPDRDAHRDMWEGAIDQKLLMKISGVDGVITINEFKEILSKVKIKVAGSLTPPETYISQMGIYTNPHRSTLQSFLEACGFETKDLRLELARLRQIKQPCEIDTIKRAINITTKTLSSIKPLVEELKTEDALERELSAKFLLNGSKYHAYSPIIASGKNAATIHYEKNDSAIRNNELLLLDVGAEYQGYASDITRTWAIGVPTKRQRLVYDLVAEIQQYAFGLLKPGVRVREYERQVADFVAELTQKQGLISKKTQVRSIYPHATSHFMGLDVHDAADYDMPLEPGMVMTVEPGLYLTAEGIGVRIEDDVLITEKGIENLSADLSSEL